MAFSRVVSGLLYLARSSVAALFAGVAMALSVSAIPAFANPKLSFGILLLILMNYLPIAAAAASPVAICFIIVDFCMRRSRSRLVALFLAAIGSAGLSAAALAPKLLPAGLSNPRSPWLIALGVTGGVIGACVFAFLTSRERSGQHR